MAGTVTMLRRMPPRTAAMVILLLAFLLPLQSSYVLAQQNASKKLYVAYLGEKQHEDPQKTTASHHDMLTTILRSKEEALDSIIYSYKHGFSGFAAMLTESQAQQLSELPEVRSIKLSSVHQLHTTRSQDFLGLDYTKPTGLLHDAKHGDGVIIGIIDIGNFFFLKFDDHCVMFYMVRSIKPSSVHPLHTTHSQDFLGLDYTKPTGLLHDAKHGDGVIIGIIDSGIWPESASFSDDGLGPVPSKWKGICQAGQEFRSNQCNRKIIGARWYDNHLKPMDLEGEYRSARDADGHGTHVASTAAGALVRNVSFYGLAGGYARGTAPRARLAVYKACWGIRCDEGAVLQAIDDAIHDGVDVLSLSLGKPSNEHYGSLHAVNNGITVVFAAGNDGPAPRTVTNVSPWGISVASATIDRAFPTVITLANSTSNFVGQSLFYEPDDKGNWYEIYRSRCLFGTPDPETTDNVTLAAGKIVLCYSPDSVSLISPTLSPVYNMALALKALKEAGAKGIIFATYAFDMLHALESCGSMPCVLVDFDVANQILPSADQNTTTIKFTPARTWIGGEVLAPKISTFSSRRPSPLLPKFLKMACPHVSGVAALLKALHPDWSPAIIKSALMTTASIEKYGLPILADGLPQKMADPFDYGGGCIDPNRAVDPGLAYDVDPKDYTALGCHYANSSCEYKYLNLPSIAIPNLKAPTTVLRTVTNVDQANAVYKAVVQSPPGVQISVEPSVLEFSEVKKKQSFKVTFTMTRKVQGGYLFGSLAWHDNGTHYVRIPIAVRPVVSDNYADV